MTTQTPQNTSSRPSLSIEDACRLACASIGVIYKPVPADGEFHAADLADDPKGKNDARIKIFQDRLGGLVFNHKSGLKEGFFVNDCRKSSEPIPAAELERIQREQQKRQEAQKERQNKAAKKAQALWDAALPAPDDHPYLARKQIKPHGARVGTWKRPYQDEHGSYHQLFIENALLVPLLNPNGVIQSLQAIFAEKHPILNRDKDILAGSSLAGLFWLLGAKTDKVLIAEGFATGSTLYEETGYRTYLAFTANNLMKIGLIVREKLPDAEIVFCADNDTKTPGNPGLTKATEAAQAVGGSVIAPPVPGDFNDYAISLKEVMGDNAKG